MSDTPSDTQEIFLCNAFGDSYLYSVNQEDFNETGSRVFYQEHINPGFFHEQRLHLVLGTDSGLLPKYLLEQGIPKAARYIFVELDGLIEQIEPLFPEHPRLMLTRAEDAFARLNEQTELGEAFYFFHGHVLLHNSAGSISGYLEGYADLRQTLIEEFQLRTFIHQARGFQRSHELNRLINAPEPSDSAAHIKGIFAGKTAVVMAAGHSLTRNFDWIKANRQNLVLISISRICHTLKKYDLVPDIITSIDPFAVNFHQSIGIYNFPQSLFAHSAYCNHNMIGLWGNRRVTLGGRFSWQSRYNEGFVESYAMTVSNIAMDLAWWLGCSQIVLLGVDLCHDSQGGVYADAPVNPARALQGNLLKVKTNRGTASFTTRDYLEASRGMSIQAQYFLENGVVTLNPSAGAIAMDGIEYRPIEDIQLEPMAEPALERIHAALPAIDHMGWWQGMEKELRGKIKDLQGLQKLVAQGQMLLKVIQGGNKGQKNPFEKLRKITARLDDDILDAGDAAFVKKIHWPDFAEVSIVLENGEEGAAIKAQVQYMKAWNESLIKTIGYLRLALEKLNLLRREYQAAPEAGIDTKAWEDLLKRQPMEGFYGEDGNCHRWIETYPGKWPLLNVSQQTWLRDCARSFEERALTGPPPPPPADDQSMLEALKGVPALVRQFIKLHDIEALETLTELLEQFPEELSQAMRHYCLGQKAELEQQPQEAIAAYEACLAEEHGPEARLVLERIGQLSLDTGDFDKALDSLSRLQEISPSYLKTRAEVLTLLERTDEAIDAFTQYLAQYPSDMHTMPTLAQLLLGQGELERLLQLTRTMEAHNPGAPLMQELIGLVEKAIETRDTQTSG